MISMSYNKTKEIFMKKVFFTGHRKFELTDKIKSGRIQDPPLQILSSDHLYCHIKKNNFLCIVVERPEPVVVNKGKEA